MTGEQTEPKQPARLQQLYETLESKLRAGLERHARILVWIGLALCVAAAVPAGLERIPFSPAGIREELKRKEDIHNLYYAAADSSWRDAPRWWVGPWIYPNVGFYRPLTSMLFLFEYQAFGSNFTAYNCVSLLLHLGNIALLYLLAVSLFRKHRQARVFVGMAAAYFFASSQNSMYFAVMRVLEWWPAQNDILSLNFALLFLLLLDQYLHHPKRWLLACSVLSLFLGIASKEMAFIAAPIALALVAQRRALGIGPWRAPVLSVTVLTAFMWFFRRIVVPTHWGPVMFRWQIVDRMLITWAGPGGLMARSGTYWPAAAAAVITLITTVGLRLRWPIAWILSLCAVSACLITQYLVPDGTFAILLFWPDQDRLFSTLTYLLAVILFVRYRKLEPGLFAGVALWLVYLPILHYGGGRHYYYWPGAFNALADAAFLVCLWRWACELRSGANWECRLPIPRRVSEREKASAS
jgi:hypothetical protein